MSEQIAEMVRKGDADAIQKYVKNQLPSDQPSLERIYKELLHYNEQPEQLPLEKKEKTVRSSSLKMLPRREVIINSYAPEAAIEKRTNNMIRLLREKGFKVMADDEEEGLRLFKTQRERIVAPLKTNAKLLQGGEAEIDRLIERYNANPDFYNNNIEDVHVNLDTNIDRDMRGFIDRRQSVLQSLRRKQNLEINHSSKYSTIPCKLFSQRKMSQEPMISLRKTPRENPQLQSTRNLLKNCENQILAKKFKEIPTQRNDFRDLQNRLSYQDDDLNLASIINIQRVKEKLSKQQYDRYTHSYMKMMTNKTQEGSKCKLNAYAKELLQDERKMRNIIDFSKK